jgi:hypothetical protein
VPRLVGEVGSGAPPAHRAGGFFMPKGLPIPSGRGMLRPMNETLKKVSLLGVAAPMLVSTWSGWVGLGTMCGFGIIQPFPGISGFELDTRITLPMGSEFYMIIGMSYAISRGTTRTARRFAAWSTGFALVQSLAAQVAYHYMHSQGVDDAPWGVIVAVSASLVLTLASAMMLYHLSSEPEVVVEDVTLVEEPPAPVEAHEEPQEAPEPIEAPEEPPAPVEAVTEPQAIEAPMPGLDDDERTAVLDRWIAGGFTVGEAVALLGVSRSRAFALRNQRRDGAI